MCEGLFFQKVSDVLIVTLGRYWLIHDSSGSVTGNTSWFLDSIGWYWLKYDGAGSVQGGTGRYLVDLGQ